MSKEIKILKNCLLSLVGKIKIILAHFAYVLTELLPIWLKKSPPFGNAGEKNPQKSVFPCLGQFHLVVGLVKQRI